MSNKLILQLLIASAFIGTHLNAITETVYNLSNGIAYVTNANLMNKKLLNMNDSISQPTVSTIYISSGNIYNNNKLSLQGYAYLQISSGPKTNSIQVNEYDSYGKLSNSYTLTDNNSLYIFRSPTTSGLQVQNTSTPPANATAQAKPFTIFNSSSEDLTLFPCNNNNQWSPSGMITIPKQAYYGTTITIPATSNYYCTRSTQTHPNIVQFNLTTTPMTISEYDISNKPTNRSMTFNGMKELELWPPLDPSYIPDYLGGWHFFQ